LVHIRPFLGRFDAQSSGTVTDRVRRVAQRLAKGVTMKARFTYEIATSAGDGRWTTEVGRTQTFVRQPREIARSLLELWIMEHRSEVPGGARVMVYGGLTRMAPAVAYVRVRLYSGDTIDETARPVAIAYLGERASDCPVKHLGLVQRWRLAREYRRHLARRQNGESGGEVA
jgi:hypothetical protein